MVKKMFDKIAEASYEKQVSKSKDEFDHYYFARRVDSLKTFSRYFRQLFRETFAPFIDEDGDARFENLFGVRQCPDSPQYLNFI